MSGIHYVIDNKIFNNYNKIIEFLKNVNDDNIKIYKFKNFFEATFFIKNQNTKNFSKNLIDLNNNISKSNRIDIYTDGSCFNNGSKNKSIINGGIGVFFGNNDERNISEPFCIGEITNNRSELYAIISALESIKELNDTEIYIYTDSEYSINCITKWVPGWLRNNWKTRNNKPVKNKDLLLKLYNLNNKMNIKYIHVKGHSGNYGNSQADKLAVEGSKKNYK